MGETSLPAQAQLPRLEVGWGRVAGQTGPKVLGSLWQTLKEHLSFKGELPDPLRYTTEVLTPALSLRLTALSLGGSFASANLEPSGVW